MPQLCTKMHLLYVLGDTVWYIYFLPKSIGVCHYVQLGYVDMTKPVVICETQNQDYFRKLQNMGRKPKRSLMREKKAQSFLGGNSFTICTSHKQSCMIHNKGVL